MLLLMFNYKQLSMCKKVSILFVAFAATMLSGNAQVFVGGNLGGGYSGGKTETTGSAAVDLPSTSTFRVNPFVGYQLTEAFSLGVKIGIDTEIQKRQVSATTGTGNVEQTTSTLEWDFGFFGRYSVWRHNRFSALLEATSGVGGGTRGKVTGPTPSDGSSILKFTFGVVPGLSYNLSDRWSVETWLNLMKFSLNSTTTTTKNANVDPPTERKRTDNSFNLGVNDPWSPWNTFTTFRIGFVFKI